MMVISLPRSCYKHKNTYYCGQKFVIILFVVGLFEHFYKQTLHSQIEIQCRTSIVLEVKVVAIYICCVCEWKDEKSATGFLMGFRQMFTNVVSVGCSAHYFILICQNKKVFRIL